MFTLSMTFYKAHGLSIFKAMQNFWSPPSSDLQQGAGEPWNDSASVLLSNGKDFSDKVELWS